MSFILSEQWDAQTLLLTLNRPEKLNALAPGLLGELIDVLRAVNHRRDIRSVVITGAGKGFCSGADLAPDPDAGEVPGR